MDCKVISYYRTGDGSWVFEPGQRFSPIGGREHILRILTQGDDVWQLHLDNEEDFRNIRKAFFTTDYWDGRSWQDEYNAKPKNI